MAAPWIVLPPALRVSHWRDALVVSDPQRERLRLGARAALTTAASTAILLVAARALGQPLTVPLVGIAVSMMQSVVVQDATLAEQRATTALLALAAVAAVAIAGVVPVEGATGPLLFLAIVFGAVLARRFGPRGNALGTIAFLSYFDTRFFGARPDQVPWMVASVVAGTVVTFVVRFAVVRDRREDALERALHAYRCSVAMLLARVEGAARAERWTRGWTRALSAAVRRVNEAALGVEEEAERRGGIDATELRARVLDLELEAERVARAVHRFVDEPRRPSDAERAAVTRALACARVAVRCPTEEHGRTLRARAAPVADPALAEALRDFAVATMWLRAPPRGASIEPPPARNQPTPSAGSLRLATQATVACALAILVGRELSPARWYWAVIAAFVVFTRATTRGETLLRAWHRVLGTVAGVIVGLLLAKLVEGHVRVELALVFVCIFLGMYWMRVSYARMVLAITTVIAILYGLLGRFSPGLLVLRIEETIAGAVIGAAVAMVLMPSRTVSKVRDDAAALMREVAEYLRVAGEEPRRGDELARRARRLDAKLRDLRAAARPLTGGWLVVDPTAERLVRTMGALVFRARQLAAEDDAAADARAAARSMASSLSAHADGVATALARGEPPPATTPLADDPLACGEDEPLHWLARVAEALADVGDAARALRRGDGRVAPAT